MKHVEDVADASERRQSSDVVRGRDAARARSARASWKRPSMLSARACLILEARAPGITPDGSLHWLEPFHGKRSRAVFARRLLGGANDNLVYPLMRTFLGRSARAAGERVLRLGSVCATFGHRRHLGNGCGPFRDQRLGAPCRRWPRIARLSRWTWAFAARPAASPAPAGPAPVHIIGTMFRILSEDQPAVAGRGHAARQSPLWGHAAPIVVSPCRDCTADLLAALP